MDSRATPSRPTRAQVRALVYVRDHRGEVTAWPAGHTTEPVRQACLVAGWLLADRPLPGSKVTRWTLTSEGRAALEAACNG